MTKLQDQLRNLLKDKKRVKELKTADGQTVEKVLKKEAQRLRDLIQKHLNLALSHSSSTWYTRTGALAKSLNDIKVDKSNNSVTIGFDKKLAEHDSYFTKRSNSYLNNGGKSYTHKGYAPLLFDDGFKLLFTNRRFEPTNYMEKAITEYTKDKPSWISVRLQKTFEGNTYYDKIF